MPTDRTRLGLAALVALSLVLFLSGLNAPLLEPQETRYAQIPREMLADGDFVIPHLFGQPYLDKPPLLYWLVALSYQVFGERDGSARLVPALAGILTVFVTCWWAWRIHGSAAGLMAGFVLLLSAKFLYLGRLLTFDSPLMFFTTLSLAAASAGRRGWVVSGLAAGLGVLTKGPVAIVIVAVPLLVTSLIDSSIRPRAWLVWFVLALLPSTPWFLSAEWRQPGFAMDFLLRHHIERYVTPFDHAKPFWFYMPDVLWGTLPWSLALPAAGAWAWRTKGGSLTGLVAAGWCLAFFSASGCKRATYILPALPPMAMLLGAYLSNAEPRKLRWLGSVRTAGAMAILLTAGVLFAWPLYANKFSLLALARAIDDGSPIVFVGRRWDSLAYYLPGRSVIVWPADRLNEVPSDAIVVRRESQLPPEGIYTEVIARHGGLIALRSAKPPRRG